MSLLSEDFLIWHNGVPLIVVVNDTEFAIWINAVPFEDQQTIGAALASSQVTNTSFAYGTLTAKGRLAGRSDSYAFIRGNTPPIAFGEAKFVNFTKLTGTLTAKGRMAGKSVNYSTASITELEEAGMVKLVSYSSLRGTLVGVGRMAGRSDSYTNLREAGFVGIVPPVGTTFTMLSMSSLSGTLVGIGALHGRSTSFSVLKPHLTALGRLQGASFSYTVLRSLILGIAPIDGRVMSYSALSLNGRLIGLGGLHGRVVNYTAYNAVGHGLGHMFGRSDSYFWWAVRTVVRFDPIVPIVINPTIPATLLDNKNLRPGLEYKRRIRNIKWPVQVPVREVVRFGTPPITPSAPFRFSYLSPLVTSHSVLRGTLVDGTILVTVTMSGRVDSVTVIHAIGSRQIAGPAPGHGPRVGPPFRPFKFNTQQF